MENDFLVLTLIRDAEACSLAHHVLRGEGHRVVAVRDYQEVSSILQTGVKPYLILIEPDKLELDEFGGLRQLGDQMHKGKVCLILGAGDNRAASDARSLGYEHILRKPVVRRDIEALVDQSSELSAKSTCVKVGVPRSSALKLPAALSAWGPSNPLVEELNDNRFFLAASPSMLDIYRQVKLLADVDVSVLILGESGTGKEVVAHLIHKYSRRSQQKFLKVNCAALPMDLLESELFGHVKGAFTGAVSEKAGKFKLAHKGTLLLDEIGEISPFMQAKLLHVLQDRQFTPLGGRDSTQVDVHILAATNIPMETALTQKTFREDLYYRLNTFSINIPPLRERREEIPLLVNEMIRRMSPDLKPAGFTGFSSQLMEMLTHYHWPGNLRQLHNFVIRTTVIQDEAAAIADLEKKILVADANHHSWESEARHGPRGMRSVLRDVKDRTEAEMIQEALEVARWNRRVAAQRLSISYRALLYKIQQYQLVPRGQRI